MFNHMMQLYSLVWYTGVWVVISKAASTAETLLTKAGAFVADVAPRLVRINSARLFGSTRGSF